jgi:hypothetical protein
MATGMTGFDDVTSDLISVQNQSLQACHDYDEYVRRAEQAGQGEIASFFRDLMKQDAERAARCLELVKQRATFPRRGPARREVTVAEPSRPGLGGEIGQRPG